MLKVVNAMGDACPIPVVKTKNAIKELSGAGMIETLVDNEIAVQNLTKMAQQKNYGVRSEKLGENQYRVIMTIGESADEAGAEAVEDETTAEETCMPDGRKKNSLRWFPRTAAENEIHIPMWNLFCAAVVFSKKTCAR